MNIDFIAWAVHMFNRLSCFDSIRLMYHQNCSFALHTASLMNICSIRLCEIFYKAEINPRIGSSLNLGLKDSRPVDSVRTVSGGVATKQ